MKRVAPSATVISLVPFPIHEPKPGMTPSEFHIDPAPDGGFSTLLVTGCKHGVYLDENRPVLVVPTSPDEVAEAICFDYMKGQMGLEIGVAEPGIFWVQGDYTDPKSHPELLATAQAEFKTANTKQLEWFKRLVADADDAWSKFHRRGMISNVQKIAAAKLKLDREWLLEAEVQAAMSECPVCYTKVHPRAIICRECKTILDEKAYAERKFAGKTEAATVK